MEVIGNKAFQISLNVFGIVVVSTSGKVEGIPNLIGEIEKSNAIILAIGFISVFVTTKWHERRVLAYVLTLLAFTSLFDSLIPTEIRTGFSMITQACLATYFMKHLCQLKEPHLLFNTASIMTLYSLFAQ